MHKTVSVQYLIGQGTLTGICNHTENVKMMVTLKFLAIFIATVRVHTIYGTANRNASYHSNSDYRQNQAFRPNPYDSYQPKPDDSYQRNEGNVDDEKQDNEMETSDEEQMSPQRVEDYDSENSSRLESRGNSNRFVEENAHTWFSNDRERSPESFAIEKYRPPRSPMSGSPEESDQYVEKDTYNNQQMFPQTDAYGESDPERLSKTGSQEDPDDDTNSDALNDRKIIPILSHPVAVPTPTVMTKGIESTKSFDLVAAMKDNPTKYKLIDYENNPDTSTHISKHRNYTDGQMEEIETRLFNEFKNNNN